MKLKKSIIFYLLCLLFFTGITLIVFSPYSINLIKAIINHETLELSEQYIIKYDYGLQHIPFYQEFFTQLDSGKIGWSWNQLFGINFYGSKGYYMIGDPFAYLSYFIRSFIPSIIDNIFFVTLLKLIIGGYTFSYFIGQITNKKWIRLLFGCIYITTGWCTTFIEQPNFISFYVFIPLLLAGFEKVINKRKGYLLITFSATILLYINYYLTWMLCVYILFYWILKQFIVNKSSVKDFFIESFKVLFFFLLGVGVSSIVWYPSLLHLLSNPRLSNNELITYNTYEINDLINIIKNIYVPVLKFSDSVYKNYWYYFNQIGIYSTCLLSLIVPLFFFNQRINKRTRILYLIILLLCSLTFVSPQISKIFHFTYSLRYTYIIMITLSSIGAIQLDKIKNSYNLLEISIIGIIDLAILYFIGVYIPHSQGYTTSIEIDIIYKALVILAIYLLALIILKKFTNILRIVLIVTVLCEIIYMGHLPIISQRESGESYVNYITDYDKYEKLISTLKKYDDSFYRLRLDNCYYNEGMYFNIPTLSTYDTMYEFTMRDFIEWNKGYPDATWNFIITFTDILPMTNTKYMVFENYTDDLDYYLYYASPLELEDTSFYVMQMNDNASLARTVTSLVTEDEFNSTFDENSFFHEISYYLSTNYIADKETYNILKKYPLSASPIYADPSYINNNNFTMDIDTDDNYILFISVPNNPGWEYKINSNVVETYKIHGGFTALVLEKGHNHIEASFTVPGLNKAKLIALTSLGLIAVLIIKDLIQYIMNRIKLKHDNTL